MKQKRDAEIKSLTKEKNEFEQLKAKFMNAAKKQIEEERVKFMKEKKTFVAERERFRTHVSSHNR